MAQQLDRATIEYAQAELLNQLDAANERLTEASFEAAMPGGDDKPMLAANADVSRIKQLLIGIRHGLEKMTRQEREQEAAERARERREAAVQARKLMHLRARETAGLDEHFSAIMIIRERIDHLGNQLRAMGAWFPEDDAGQQAMKNFLGSLHAWDVTDTEYRVQQDIGQDPGGYARGLAFERRAAERVALAAFPEFNDEDVKAEAKALADEEMGVGSKPGRKGSPAPRRKLFKPLKAVA